jgi:hypothetical protein
VARQVSRSKGGNETVALVVASAKLREDQFAATEELTASERTIVALNAIERLLVDPPAIDRAMRETMSRVKVDAVLFAEPSAEDVESVRASALTFSESHRLAELLVRVKDAVHSGR